MPLYVSFDVFDGKNKYPRQVYFLTAAKKVYVLLF